MKKKKEAYEYLNSIGVSRWDTNPPAEGKIKWYNKENNQVAEADYQVILSVGPGNKYTMGYDIGVYKSMGIPFMEKQDELPSIVENLKTDAEIWERAENCAEKAGAEFAYQCGTLLVGVFGLKEV